MGRLPSFYANQRLKLKSLHTREFLNVFELLKYPELYRPIASSYIWRIGKKLKILKTPHNPFGDTQISAKDFNPIAYKILCQAITSKTPLMMGRYGNVECESMRDVLLYERGILRSLKNIYTTLCKNAGFFPKDLSSTEEQYGAMKHFANLMLKATSNCDILGTWSGGLAFEKYFIDHYAKKDIILTELGFFRPQFEVDTPFSYAFRDATLLVVHPFAQTIQSQYKNYDKLFENKKILPHFHLKTFKAVQTINDEQDNRFKDWFEALEWMTHEISKIDFDIALIGCGAYGFPLASNIKDMGKIAIHCGGATQLFFGIKGRRWEIEQPSVGKNLFNDFWTRPNQDEIIKNRSNIEGGCYW